MHSTGNLSNTLSENTADKKNSIRMDIRHSWHSNYSLEISPWSNANEFSAMCEPYANLQMRAVSSPSLNTDTQANIPMSNSKLEPYGIIQKNHELSDRGNSSASSGSVLQKFKNTLFKNGKPNFKESTKTKNRFGPLIWRSSKDRQKTKSYRRDKCNSGDSGIQVELDNDESLSPIMNISTQFNTKVRRANSAKVTPNTSIKSQNIGPLKSAEASITSQRSLSQPSDLDVIVLETKLMNNLEKIKHIDGSETDSLSSNVDEIEEGGRSGVVYAEVLYHFRSGGPQELSLQKGSLVEVLKRETGPWWWGRIKYEAVISGDGVEIRHGWFPKNFVKVIPTFGFVQTRKITNQSDNHCDNHLTYPAAPSDSSIQSIINCEVMRDNVIKELLETEINYVKLLNALVDGYIKEIREHLDVFSMESIFVIFSNMEQIYNFQQTFLEALRIAIPNGKIAEVFLEFQSAFMVYSHYCNSYPRALMELETFCGNKEASGILENCRVAQNLPELPLSAHLLAPIQRICRYPLHLSELVKHSRTRKDILLGMNVQQLSKGELETMDSKEMFEVALNAMKRMTGMVNEGKRHSEYLSRIQSRFESFQGPSINVYSTRLFLQTDAIRVSPNIWNNTYTLFLFDRQLIYCKKDLLKRSSYIYKGRIFLDNCRILNLSDGKMFGINLKNALRIFCETRGKWFDFCFRSSSSKRRFLNTLSAERQFCGSNLFVSELAPGMNDENLSDDTNCLSQVYKEREVDVEAEFKMLLGNVQSSGSMESPLKQQKFSNTLPKNPRMHFKEIPSQIIIDHNLTTSTSNINKKRLGNWFRKSKNTSNAPSILNHSDNNSSQSPPRPKKFEEAEMFASSWEENKEYGMPL